MTPEPAHRTSFGRLGRKLLAALLRAWGELGSATSVLEVGCGTGHFTRWLSMQGTNTVGLDISKPMLAQASLADTSALLQGDAVALPFADGTFDLVAFITTLEFLPDPTRALMEGLRVARKGLLLGVMNRWSWLGAARRLATLIRPNVYREAHFYSLHELERLLQRVSRGGSTVSWQTTLWPRWWPLTSARLPWGGFVAMAVRKKAVNKPGVLHGCRG